MTSILMIDDEIHVLEPTARRLTQHGYEVATASLPTDAVDMLKVRTFDIIICDYRMPGMTGLELQKKAQSLSPKTAFILCTAYGTDETVAEMFREGGIDYQKKPFTIQELLGTIRRVEEIKGKQPTPPTENAMPRQNVTSAESVEKNDVVCRGKAMSEVMVLLKKAAASNAPVLLTGESGTGKEVMARLIHSLSARTDKVFQSINCGAIPESLLEAELFGHVRGAFTGAVETRKGVFETADGGTIFLDEIGEIPLHLQVKMLRVLQEGELYRVGDPVPRTVNVRVVAATNRNLEQGVAEGWFRLDLYYRLNVIPILLPPLRDRDEDLPALIDHFMAKYAKGSGKTHKLSDGARKLLLKYTYPGNIRELENAIEFALVMCDDTGTIKKEDLPKQIQNFEFDAASATHMTSGGKTFDDTNDDLSAENGHSSLDEAEIKEILNAMRRAHFNKTRAAELLRITRRTLGYRIEKYQLEPQIEKLKHEIERR
ncbi:sigma-54-dependent Fis family transcriptional regulator [Candidatus Sumerlaeota bacterium]|nr:sigma-54-dependent Fis family transcriptional regulator [Candidatus Sumerlaeota bacterium]